ncbi:MAG: peptide deformylase [Myxococcales bacterium]|jgi:peptide deformylase|nr:peptide deformylase [Myxococcales bacterium]MBL0193742.1 peptide deformylase [Myxococcales bacterium]
MALLKIATVGNPILREPAREISRDELATPAMQTFLDDLIETMRDANGAGIAAPQVYRPIAACVIEVKNNPRYPYKPNIPLTVLINPVLTPLGDETFLNYEGCLSVPNLRGEVRRSARVRVQAQDRHGRALDFEAAGLAAGTYQHEVDHLLATLFVDRVEDPRSLSTWTDFERFHLEAFVARAKDVVARYGS